MAKKKKEGRNGVDLLPPKGAYSLEEAMTNLAARAKAAGLGYERPMKAAQEARDVNKRKKLSK